MTDSVTFEHMLWDIVERERRRLYDMGALSADRVCLDSGHLGQEDSGRMVAYRAFMHVRLRTALDHEI